VGKISRGWQLTKLSFGVIRKDKEILLFPVISGLVLIAIAASFIVPWFLTTDFSGGSSDISLVFYIFWIIFYFISFTISTFFTVAMMGCAMMRLDGGDPTFSYGLRFAAERFKYIVEWALVAATVGLILRAIEQRSGLIGKIIIGIIGLAWSIATYFVLPVLAFEKLTPFKAMKRSASVLKSSWGEALFSNLGIGLIFFLLALVGIVVMVLGIYLIVTVSVIIGIIMIIIAVLYWVFLAVLSSAVHAVLMTALYRFATTGKTSMEFPAPVLQNPWNM
jgi:Family of unknown function (DUF6159)